MTDMKREIVVYQKAARVEQAQATQTAALTAPGREVERLRAEGQKAVENLTCMGRACEQGRDEA